LRDGFYEGLKLRRLQSSGRKFGDFGRSSDDVASNDGLHGVLNGLAVFKPKRIWLADGLANRKIALARTFVCP